MIIDPDKERERFISLREVLFMIAEVKQCDPQKAAEWLVLNMPHMEGMYFKVYSPLHGLVNLHRDSEPHEGTGIVELDTLIYKGCYKKIKPPVRRQISSPTPPIEDDFDDFDDFDRFDNLNY